MNFFLSMMAALSIFGFRSAKDPEAVLDRKICEYSRILQATNNLQISGLGRGFKDEKIAIVGVDYNICKDVQLDEARLNIVKLTEFYLLKINSDPELQPLLFTNPFNLKNLELGISYMRPTGGFSAEIARSFTKEGLVYYSKYDPSNGRLERIHIEPYEEALAILNSNKVVSE